MNNLDALFKTSTNIIEDIATSSKHKRIILSSLNAHLKQHPEHRKCIYSLTSYAKQKWALEQDIKCNNSELFKNSSLISDDALIKYQYSIKLIELINEDVLDEYFKKSTFKDENEYLAFESVHDLNSDDISKYLMNTYYPRALNTFCKKRGKEIERLYLKTKMKKELEEDNELVYHDGEIFIKTIRYLIKTKKVLVEINEETLNSLIKQLVSKVKNYPLSGTTLNTIMTKYVFEGKSDLKIAHELCCSETFVINKRKLATELISMMLWGYAAKNVTEGE